MNSFFLIRPMHRVALAVSVAMWLLWSPMACAPQGEESGGATEAQVGDGEVIAFTGVHVIPMDRERVLEDQTVLVADGLIAAVGPSAEVSVPEGTTRIDGQGRYLIPGLAEMHGHLPNPDMPEEVTENVLFLYVANGITTVRGMQGNASQLELRKRIDSGDVMGPRLILGGPSMTGNRVESVEDARRLVREYHQAGFDLLKVHEGLSPEVYDAIAETATELGMPFAGHVTDHVGLFHALESGQTTIDHLDNYIQALVPPEKVPADAPGLRGIGVVLDLVDESRMEQVVQATLDADGSVVPTMVLWESGLFPTEDSVSLLAERNEVRYMPQETVERWASAVDDRLESSGVETNRRVGELRRRVLRALHEGGVRVLLGTDSPQIFSVPGFSIHREMALYVDTGWTPYQVLASGTRVVGEYFGEDFGTVAPGQRADLVLLEANPLDDIGNVARRVGVMVAGRYISEEEIAERLETVAAYYSE